MQWYNSRLLQFSGQPNPPKGCVLNWELLKTIFSPQHCYNCMCAAWNCSSSIQIRTTCKTLRALTTLFSKPCPVQLLYLNENWVESFQTSNSIFTSATVCSYNSCETRPKPAPFVFSTPSTLLANTSTHETDGASSVLNWEPTLEHSDEAILLSDMHTSPATSWTEYFKVPIVPKNPQL